ncbi:MAG TPA: hypothetical protein DGT21_24820 [Armatimonadetes bacterium]|nr:hypothetical protein [Armatimonadota bacterium]
MKAGICSIIWKENLDIFEVINTAARVGAAGIEVWGQAPHIADADDLDHVARIREAIEVAGLQAPQFGSYARAGADGFVEMLTRDLKVTGGLCAPACRIWPGVADSEDTGADGWARVVADLKEACRIAADMGLLITLERHGGTVTNTLWGCRRIIDEVDDPALWINYQIGTRIDEETLAEEVRSLAPYILNVHATNHTFTDGQRVWMRLADGDVDWAGLIAELQANGVDDAVVEVEFARRGTGEISLEETETELAADIEFLKQCMSS